MSKLKMSSHAIYFVLCVVIMSAFSWIAIGYIQLDFNPLNWSEDLRGRFVFVITSVLTLSYPIAGMIDNS